MADPSPPSYLTSSAGGSEAVAPSETALGLRSPPHDAGVNGGSTEIHDSPMSDSSPLVDASHAVDASHTVDASLTAEALPAADISVPNSESSQAETDPTHGAQLAPRSTYRTKKTAED